MIFLRFCSKYNRKILFLYCSLNIVENTSEKKASLKRALKKGHFSKKCTFPKKMHFSQKRHFSQKGHFSKKGRYVKINTLNSDPNFIRKTVYAVQLIGRGSYNPPKDLPKLMNRSVPDPRALTTNTRTFGRGYNNNSTSRRPNQASLPPNINRSTGHLSTSLDSSGRNVDTMAGGVLPLGLPEIPWIRVGKGELLVPFQKLTNLR